jgi:hypothetical protein
LERRGKREEERATEGRGERREGTDPQLKKLHPYRFVLLCCEVN